MNRLSSRNNRLKFTTSGDLPIILEESIEYTSNEWKKHQNMPTCNRLDLESLESWPTMPKNFPGTDWEIWLVDTFFPKHLRHSQVDILPKTETLIPHIPLVRLSESDKQWLQPWNNLGFVKLHKPRHHQILDHWYHQPNPLYWIGATHWPQARGNLKYGTRRIMGLSTTVQKIMDRQSRCFAQAQNGGRF